MSLRAPLFGPPHRRTILVACIQAVTVAVAGSCDRYWSDSVPRRLTRRLTLGDRSTELASFVADGQVDIPKGDGPWAAFEARLQ
jgi:hypothetical protein